MSISFLLQLFQFLRPFVFTPLISGRNDFLKTKSYSEERNTSKTSEVWEKDTGFSAGVCGVDQVPSF